MHPINRQIVALDKARGQLVVKWWSDDIPEGIKVAVDLPIRDGRIVVLEGEELDSYLMGFCPVAEFERAACCKEGATDFSALEKLVEPEAPAQPETPPAAAPATIPSPRFLAV